MLKAACLLSKPPRPVEFIDEQEMRFVYSLIYEVFRCEFTKYFSLIDSNYDENTKVFNLLVFPNHKALAKVFCIDETVKIENKPIKSPYNTV